MKAIERSTILPEPELPDADQLLGEGRALAGTTRVGACPFYAAHGVASEGEYKRRSMAERTLMFHAQFGYRDFAKSRRAYHDIYEGVTKAGYSLERYGICLDWSMGYPASSRADMPRGTGMILDTPEDFRTLAQEAPVAPHFGDFVIGTRYGIWSGTCRATRRSGRSACSIGSIPFIVRSWPGA